MFDIFRGVVESVMPISQFGFQRTKSCFHRRSSEFTTGCCWRCTKHRTFNTAIPTPESSARFQQQSTTSHEPSYHRSPSLSPAQILQLTIRNIPCSVHRPQPHHRQHFHHLSTQLKLAVTSPKITRSSSPAYAPQFHSLHLVLCDITWPCIETISQQKLDAKFS